MSHRAIRTARYVLPDELASLEELRRVENLDLAEMSRGELLVERASTVAALVHVARTGDRPLLLWRGLRLVEGRVWLRERLAAIRRELTGRN